MIARSKINLGKGFGTSELIKKDINVGQGIFVLYCQRIEWTIVNTHPQTTTILLHKKSGTSPRRRTWANVYDEDLD
jgi:hypothetical protein